MARLACLADWLPELELDPPTAETWLDANLAALCAGRRGLDELGAIDLGRALLDGLDWELRQRLDRDAPARFELPGGDSAAITYERGKPPVLTVRIQRLFGLDVTPAVAGGRVPLLLHLCAPNGRPAQVTDDLPGFWRGSYALVRKELRGRYPKHPWPEEPQLAEPPPLPRRRR